MLGTGEILCTTICTSLSEAIARFITVSSVRAGLRLDDPARWLDHYEEGGGATNLNGFGGVETGDGTPPPEARAWEDSVSASLTLISGAGMIRRRLVGSVGCRNPSRPATARIPQLTERPRHDTAGL